MGPDSFESACHFAFSEEGSVEQNTVCIRIHLFHVDKTTRNGLVGMWSVNVYTVIQLRSLSLVLRDVNTTTLPFGVVGTFARGHILHPKHEGICIIYEIKIPNDNQTQALVVLVSTQVVDSSLKEGIGVIIGCTASFNA